MSDSSSLDSEVKHCIEAASSAFGRLTKRELFEKAGITPAEHLLLQRQLRWLGHVIRMPDNQLPRRLLYGKLTEGQRSVGRPKKRFIDHIKANLLKCNIKPSDLEVLVSDRDMENCL